MSALEKLTHQRGQEVRGSHEANSLLADVGASHDVEFEES